MMLLAERFAPEISDFFADAKLALGNSEILKQRAALAGNCNVSPRTNEVDRNKPLF